MLILWATVPQVVHAVGIVSLQVPPDSTVSWVADDLEHNGIPMQIQVLRSDQSPENVLEFYRDLWEPMGEGDIPGYVENQIGEWAVISALYGDSSMVVQVKPGDFVTTEGFISEINPNRAPNTVPVLEDIPLPDGTDTMSTSSSNDRIQKSVTAVLMNRLTVDDNFRFFKNRMKQRGWKFTTSSDTGSSSVLLFSRRDGYSEISISSAGDGTSILMINRVSNN